MESEESALSTYSAYSTFLGREDDPITFVWNETIPGPQYFETKDVLASLLPLIGANAYALATFLAPTQYYYKGVVWFSPNELHQGAGMSEPLPYNLRVLDDFKIITIKSINRISVNRYIPPLSSGLETRLRILSASTHRQYGKNIGMTLRNATHNIERSEWVPTEIIHEGDQ